uniref:Uncharacterized protein n=1 Tax=Romanomermis culicivorax TaxID=13658 RepID=A0A915KQ26_ROMCU
MGKLWPQAGLPAQYAQEFCFNLKSSSETKHFQKYLKSFFENLSKTQARIIISHFDAFHFFFIDSI